MFKKLKEKITEEVKISPQRFAEFTQSVSDRLQNNTNVDENFFSIGEDDANTSANISNHGFSSVSLVSPSQDEKPRRHSNVSISSDVSFLPRYESNSMYHLQSDLDISASEMEDNVSTASSQLGHLSKEQIHSAFQKSQMRYHKYRGRFTDLARHYKDLERENAKMKAILVETQDKAIRRVQELKEQCNLEQKAKAHLESALRDEIDERNYKIKTLETKIELLQTDNDSEPPSNIENENGNHTEKLENLTKYLMDARKEIETLNEKLQEMKANTIIFQTKEQEYKMKIANFEKELASMVEREKENNLKLAQNKMELHNEILMKDTEISNMKRENEVLKQNFNTFEAENKSTGNTKLENLQSQNKKLIDKIESLSQKCNNLEKELLKVESYKIEIENLKEEILDLKNNNTQLVTEKETLLNNLAQSERKCQDLSDRYHELDKSLIKERKELEEQIANLRDEARKGLLSLEPKIREKLQNQFSQKETELKREFENKIEELSSNNVGIKEIQLQLLHKDDLIKNMSEEIEKFKNDHSKMTNDYSALETNHLELIEDCTKLRNTISNLEKEKMSYEFYEEKVLRLEAHINTLQIELRECKYLVEKKEAENIELTRELVALQNVVKANEENLKALEERNAALNLKTTEGQLLEMKVQKLEEENQILLEEFEQERKIFNDSLHDDHKDLMVKEDELHQLKIILKQCGHERDGLKEMLTSEKEKFLQLSENMLHSQREVERLQEIVRIFEEKDEAIDLDKSECSLLQLKLQKLEEEYKNLMDSFDLERETLTNDLHVIKRSLSQRDENEGTISENNLSQIVVDIRQLNEVKENEIITLSKENTELMQNLSKITEKCHLLEGKLETFQVENTELKLLELKMQKLEEENRKLVDEFEQERKVFSDLLENRKESRQKEILIEELEEKLRKITEENRKLEDSISHSETDYFKLQEEKLKLHEKIGVLKERALAVNMDETQSELLEMKLQNLEKERTALLDMLEMERGNFKKANEQVEEKGEKIKQLSDEKLEIEMNISKYNEELENLKILLESKVQLCEYIKTDAEDKIKKVQNQAESIKLLLQKSQAECGIYMAKITEISALNENFSKKLQDKDSQITQLSENISELHKKLEEQSLKYTNLQDHTEQLDMDSMKRQAQIAEFESEKLQLTRKIEEVNNEMQLKTNEMNQFNEKLLQVEKLYQEQLNNNEINREEIINLQNKNLVLQDIEAKHIALLNQEEKLNCEISRYKVALEDKDQLNQRLSELEIAFEEKVDEIKNVIEDNNKLAEENMRLQDHAGKQKLKLENENLLEQLTAVNNEMTELRLRFQQITSDYQNMTRENQILTDAKEQLEFKIQEDDSLKLVNHEDLQNRIKEENNVLKEKVDDLSRQLREIEAQNLELIAQTKESISNGLDITNIQQDLYQIREKCDSLFVENKNLKQEYTKLEEKCNEFCNIKEKMQNQIGELEKHCTEIQHEKQLLQDEVQELKISPLNYHNNSSTKLDHLETLRHEQLLPSSDTATEAYMKEIEGLRDKIKYKSLEMTNKTSTIEYYENELQKVKNQNEKLNRKLDETLVTLNHCAELSTSTEVEYLKNVLFNYMLGKESLVLARVIAAVCKFDPQQTELILQKEQQKQTLLGQLGLI